MVLKTYEDGSEITHKDVIAVTIIGFTAAAVTVGMLEMKYRVQEWRAERKAMKNWEKSLKSEN